MDENSPAHLVAAKLRADSIRVQLSSALSMCEMTETEFTLGHTDHARAAVQKLRHVTNTLSAHIQEKGHVPAHEVPGFTEQLHRLESRLTDLEKKAAA